MKAKSFLCRSLSDRGLVEGLRDLHSKSQRMACRRDRKLSSPLRRSGAKDNVNWLFTGNGGIGKVSQDMDLVWGRARHVAGAEWRLSHEDEFLNLVRHLGHGHDFDTGMLQVCVDAAAMLRVCGNEMDWDYVYEQAEAS